ncbi:MAG TPA: hypothetical protein VFQ05_10565 [Candidatus Eisenbacteria bacterium]|nr:hypothetical protein [Candidatus Eisenbacteria bacterium]
MTRSARLGLALLVALASCLSGCDYFRPAEPEPPTSTSFVPDYGSPDSTLATIAKAIADKSRTIGATAYAGAFADSLITSPPVGYHQLFWPQDVADWSSSTGGRQPPGDWGFDIEQTFYTRFIRLRPDAYHMEWAPDDLNPDNIGGNTARISRHYQVTTHASDGTRTSFQAVGFADLTLVRFSDGNWRIVLWEDRRDPDADPNDSNQMTLGKRRLNST